MPFFRSNRGGDARPWWKWPPRPPAERRAHGPRALHAAPPIAAAPTRAEAHARYAVMFLSVDGRWLGAAGPGRASHIATIADDGTVAAFSHPAIDHLAPANTHAGVARLLNSGWTPEEIRTLLIPGPR